MTLASTPTTWLQYRWSWFLLLVIPYAISILWLGPAVILVPLVILNAPQGIAKVLGNPIDTFPIFLFSHLLFWSLYLFGFGGAKILKASKLKIIFSLLAATLICTCYGCATYHVSPLNGWKELGSLTVVPLPADIRQDATTYFHSLPDSEGSIVDRDTGAVTYWEDGTGQHAVVLEAPRNGERWCYAVIYDRDNRRIKVLRYSIGSYMC